MEILGYKDGKNRWRNEQKSSIDGLTPHVLDARCLAWVTLALYFVFHKVVGVYIRALGKSIHCEFGVDLYVWAPSLYLLLFQYHPHLDSIIGENTYF